MKVKSIFTGLMVLVLLVALLAAMGTALAATPTMKLKPTTTPTVTVKPGSTMVPAGMTPGADGALVPSDQASTVAAGTALDSQRVTVPSGMTLGPYGLVVPKNKPLFWK